MSIKTKRDLYINLGTPKNKEELFNIVEKQFKDIFFELNVELNLAYVFKELLNKNEDEYYDYIDEFKKSLNELKFYYSIRKNIEISLYKSFNNNQFMKFNINKNEIDNLIDKILIDNFENFKNKIIDILTID